MLALGNEIMLVSIAALIEIQGVGLYSLRAADWFIASWPCGDA
jgi:hypothetical protein